MHTWDPDRYLAYSDERARPFVDLLHRIGAEEPRLIVDLGCGPGNLSAMLAERWPTAQVLGIDASPEMVARATPGPRLSFSVGDLRDWRADARDSVDVLVTNATLQWVPDHLELLPHLVGELAPGGWFACQVPGNFREPSHTLRRELAAEPAYVDHLAGVEHPASHEPAEYFEVLAGVATHGDVWETTYLHVLQGEDAVFDWVSSTGALPTLQALPDGLREQFSEDFRGRLRAAYPARDGRVVLPFRRIFMVARRAT